MTIPMFEKKSRSVVVTVKEADVAKDITGGTPRAVLVSPTGNKTTLTAVITNATGGIIQITIPKATVDIFGGWFIEAALALGTDDRTILQEEVLAKQSFT